MVEKVIIWGLLVVLMFALLVMAVETVIIPLDINMKFRADCRNVLLDIEKNGRLLSTEQSNLRARLESIGLESITISGTSNAKYGEEVRLYVTATYTYKPLASLFSKSVKTINFEYEKYSRSRHVFN